MPYKALYDIASHQCHTKPSMAWQAQNAIQNPINDKAGFLWHLQPPKKYWAILIICQESNDLSSHRWFVSTCFRCRWHYTNGMLNCCWFQTQVLLGNQWYVRHQTTIHVCQDVDDINPQIMPDVKTLTMFQTTDNLQLHYSHRRLCWFNSSQVFVSKPLEKLSGSSLWCLSALWQALMLHKSCIVFINV